MPLLLIACTWFQITASTATIIDICNNSFVRCNDLAIVPEMPGEEESLNKVISLIKIQHHAGQELLAAPPWYVAKGLKKTWA